MKDKIRELALSDLGNSLLLLVEAVRDLNQSQLRRLQILDSQIESLNKLAERQEALEERFENMLSTLKAVCQVCSRLNILCSPKIGESDKGPPDDEKDINQKLTDWH